jgi:Trp operon repressor
MLQGARMLWVLFIILPAGGCASIPLRSPTPAEQIDEMLKLSGLTTQIERLPEAMQSGFIQRQQSGQSRLSQENFENLLKIVAETYNASDLKQSIMDTFAAHYDRDQVLAELAILRSPLNKKMTDLETEASTPEALQEIKQYAQQLRSQPAPPERSALVRTLDRVEGATDIGVELLVSVSMAYIRIQNAANPPDKRLRQDQLEEVTGRIRRELWNSVEQSTVVTFLYMFRHIPDSELKAYIELYESETAEWFKQVTKAALITALTAAAEKAGKQMARMSPKAST